MSKLVFIRGSEGTTIHDGIKGELFLIDDEDESLVKESQWRLLHGAVVTGSNKKTAKGNRKAIFLHDLVVSMDRVIPEGMMVKFSNGNKRDLRKQNLILVDKQSKMSENTIKSIQSYETELNQMSDEEKEKLILGEKGEKND